MMKKILVALAMFPMIASAEGLAPGTFELSGSSTLGFNSGSVKQKTDAGSATTDVSQYGLDVTGLYVVIPNLSIGLNLGYDSASAKSPSGFESGTSSFAIGPAVQYEVPVAPQVAVYGLGVLGYVSQTDTADGSPDVKATGYGFGLDAGVKYFLVKNFSFNAALGYRYTSVENDEAVKVTTTTSGFGLNLGLSVYFGGGK